jgi:hypothetical protein
MELLLLYLDILASLVLELFTVRYIEGRVT